MEYKKYSQKQLERAKNADIIAFLSAYMGLEFKRAGKYYQCKQHSSLVVYADRKNRNDYRGKCRRYIYSCSKV